MFLKRYFFLAIAVMAALCATANANLLLNPGAETGAVAPEWGVSSLPGAPASGESIFDIIDAVGVHGPVSPAAGSFFFSLAEANSARADSAPLSGDGDGIGDRLRLVQDGTLPDSSQLLTLTGVFQTLGPDTAEVILTVINATNDNTFSVFNSVMTSVGAWTAFQLEIDLSALPFEAALWRVQLRGRFNGSTDFGSADLTTDVFFDDLQLIATPEASTLAVWACLGMCAGIWVIHRSRNRQLLFATTS